MIKWIRQRRETERYIRETAEQIVAELESEARVGSPGPSDVDVICGSIAEAREHGTFRTGSGDFNLRAMTIDVWEGAPTSTMHDLKQLWRPPDGDASGAAWYEQELARHWDGLDMFQRARELEMLVRWRNLMDSVDDSGDARVVVMRATFAEKVHLLAFAIDVRYGTDYSQRIYVDPMQFGVHEPNTA
jgi:hypothetical protein